MSEPKTVAATAEEIVPGLWYWGIRDERIGGHPGAAHGVSSNEGTVLIDPLPLAEEPMSRLGTVSAICLTTSSHQRSSWRLRRELGVAVWAPALVREIDEEPDERYAEGDVLPGDLEPIFAARRERVRPRRPWFAPTEWASPLAVDIAAVLAAEPFGLPLVEIARRLRRDEAAIRTTLREDARFASTGSTKARRWRLIGSAAAPQTAVTSTEPELTGILSADPMPNLSAAPAAVSEPLSASDLGY